MPKVTRRAVLVPAFLGGQAALVRWAAGEERLPAAPDLAQFPDRLGNWVKSTDDQIDPDVQAQLRADRFLSRTYTELPAALPASFFVAWFQSQRGGASQPHSPQVCFPGNGWTAVSTGVMPLETSAGSIVVNRYVVSQGVERGVAIYWYQTPRRVIASEWAAKFWIVPDAFRDRRTDTSLVRIFAWNRGRSDEETMGAAVGLAARSYPLLRGILPA